MARVARPTINWYKSAINTTTVTFNDSSGGPYDLSGFDSFKVVHYASYSSTPVQELTFTRSSNVFTVEPDSAELAEFKQGVNVVEFQFINDSKDLPNVFISINIDLATAFSGSTNNTSATATISSDSVTVEITEASVSGKSLANAINSADSKTPVNADKFGFWDSVSSGLRSVTWSVIKSTLKTYFDTLYQAVGNYFDKDSDTLDDISAGTTNKHFTATDENKLDGIESGATADQTASEIKTAYESNANTNAFTDADESKLDGIEDSADVTDADNVGSSINGSTEKTSLADSDKIPLLDSAASFVLKWFSISTLKNVFATLTGGNSFSGVQDFTGRIDADAGISFNGGTDVFAQYDVGTFTPTYDTSGTGFDSVTYDIQDGNYIRIGDFVIVSGRIRTDSIVKGSASGDVVITMPFFISTGIGVGSLTGQVGWSTNLPTQGQIIGNEMFLEYVSGTSVSRITVSDMDTGSNKNRVYFQTIYRI